MNKRGFSKLDNPSHQGATNTWLTPLWLINSLGKFDFDPCGYEGHATAKKINTTEDGLIIPWEGRVWLNPPYGKDIQKWIHKFVDHGKGIALVFARTDTHWFQGYSKLCDWIFFLKGRIKFLDAEFKESTNAGHGSVLFGFGKEPDEDVKGVLFK